MAAPRGKFTLDLTSGVVKTYDPSKHVLIKRKGKWVPMDRQVLRWRKNNAKRADAQAEAQSKVDVLNLFGEKS